MDGCTFELSHLQLTRRLHQCNANANMIFILIFIALALILLYYLDERNKNIEGIRKIPGPPTLPFIGNLLELFSDSVGLYNNLNRLVSKYGSTIKLWFGSELYLLITEPKYVGQILAMTDTGNAIIIKFFQSVFGGGLVSSTGEIWKKHRRILSPSFNNRAVAGYTATFNRNVDLLIKQLNEFTELDSADITERIWDCTLNTIIDAVMPLSKEEKAQYMEALEWLLRNSFRRTFSCFSRFDCLYKYTPQYKQEVRYAALLDALLDSAIAKRREEKVETENFKFIDYLLRMSEKEENSFTHQTIRAQLKTFIIAGMDTITSTIQFAVFELGNHPEIQAKILEETNSVLGEDANANLSHSDLEELKYTEAVCNETLRMYAPIHFLDRNLTKGITLGDHEIPAGTTVIIFISALHNSQLHFPEPERFKPERFLSENIGSILANSFIPFGSGPRICLGKKFGLTEAKLMLAKIVRNFEIRPAQPQHKLILSMAGTLKSDNGIKIQIRKRKAKEDHWTKTETGSM